MIGFHTQILVEKVEEEECRGNEKDDTQGYWYGDTTKGFGMSFGGFLPRGSYPESLLILLTPTHSKCSTMKIRPEIYNEMIDFESVDLLEDTIRSRVTPNPHTENGHEP